ncbi:unnamed protein product [Prunus armeniaca]|uniref:Uncharacterized protein n=1 Tax=Prunus armeniaca TaxID=36596 RepID=A0A6J5TZL8_PRUAR|nr:unnamed protein product [Prunus armeniaca]
MMGRMTKRFIRNLKRISPLLVAACAGVRGVPLTPNEKQTMLDLLTPPPSRGLKLRNYGTMVCLLPNETFFVSIQGRPK